MVRVGVLLGAAVLVRVDVFVDTVVLVGASVGGAHLPSCNIRVTFHTICTVSQWYQLTFPRSNRHQVALDNPPQSYPTFGTNTRREL